MVTNLNEALELFESLSTAVERNVISSLFLLMSLQVLLSSEFTALVLTLVLGGKGTPSLHVLPLKAL